MEQILEKPLVEPRAEHIRLGSAASWPAIFAGAFVAAAVSLVLFALGTGLAVGDASKFVIACC